jgi:4-hydroxybutyryl-CoA dehydratase/vinylacetyl-CoA-Delta-isomerase
MKTVEEYLESLRRRDVRLFVRGERVPAAEVVEHPLVRPSVRTIAESYRLAHLPEHEDVFTAHSPYVDARVNRFTHVFAEPDDLAKKQEMQRVLGRVTGTCFQRCVGMDALNALFNVTFETDAAHGTGYHARFLEFLRHVQREDLVSCGAMTDPKGDRRKGPSEQPDMYLRVVERREDSIVVRGAKMHQTGVVNSHEMIVMPGRSLGPDDGDFAVSFAIPVDAPGVTLVYGRSPSDERRRGCGYDQGTPYGGQEAIVLFEDVVVPMSRVFLLGETEMATPLVEYFAGHHRHSYGGCKPGNGDVLIGAAALAARLNGVERASHVRDKLVEMVHLNETLYGCGVACASKCTRTPAGSVMVDPMLANITKHNVTRFPYEIGRLAEDLAGGLMATLPSQEDFEHPEIGPLLTQYVRGAQGSGEDRARVLRLIESMTLGTTSVPLRTEAMHGAGSPQAQRVRIAQQVDMDAKVALAARIAGVSGAEPPADLPQLSAVSHQG